MPPLRHEWVFRLVQLFPKLRFELNGHVQSVEEAAAMLALRFAAKSNVESDSSAVSHDAVSAAAHELRLHGVMIGRAAYHDPWMMYSNTARALCEQCDDSQQHVRLAADNDCHLRSRIQVAKAYCAYAQRVLWHASESPAAAKSAFRCGVYRPNTNTTTHASSSMRKEMQPVPYFARGCKAVHSFSELRYRLVQPLLTLFQASNMDAEATAGGPRPDAASKLRRFHALLLKSIKARKFESFDQRELDGVVAEWRKQHEQQASSDGRASNIL